MKGMCVFYLQINQMNLCLRQCKVIVDPEDKCLKIVLRGGKVQLQKCMKRHLQAFRNSCILIIYSHLSKGNYNFQVENVIFHFEM